MTMNSQRAFPLTGTPKLVWLTCFFFPTVFFAVLRAADDSFGQIPGRWLAIVPLASLIFCGTAVLFTRMTQGRKLFLVALTVVGAFIQFAFDIIVFGWLALQRSGLEGVQ